MKYIFMVFISSFLFTVSLDAEYFYCKAQDQASGITHFSPIMYSEEIVDASDIGDFTDEDEVRDGFGRDWAKQYKTEGIELRKKGIEFISIIFVFCNIKHTESYAKKARIYNAKKLNARNVRIHD